MNIEDKIVLVTGGSGFIGSHLCDSIIEENAKKLIIFDNLSASSEGNIKHLLKYNNVEFIKADIRDYEIVEKVVIESDIIFHLATSNVGNSLINPGIDMETNVGGTLNVLRALKEYPNKRMVHISSGSVLGDSDKPLREHDQFMPTTPYGISKMSGEKYAEFFAKEYGLKISIMRPFHVYGPRQDAQGKCGVINIFLSRVLKGLPPIIWGTGEQIKCFTYVEDEISAMHMMARNDLTIGNVYNVASKVRLSINELALLIIKKYSENLKMKPIYIKSKIGENMRSEPNTSKIESLGWSHDTSFEDGLEESYKWIKEKYGTNRFDPNNL